MHSEKFPESWSPQPRGELGPPLAEATIEGVQASLHREGEDVLWLRVEHGENVLFETVDESPLITGRTKERGPFFLVGSWAKLPREVRRVRVEHGGRQLEPSSSEHGWLCLLPSNASGPASVIWLDEERRERKRSEGPPIEDSGTLGPTFYVPLTE
jgi:hypothetical protein